MSRVSMTVRNAKVSVVFYFLATFTAFFTRKIFLDYLGDDFIGLTGTLKSIIGFLNIAELGIGTAIAFTLYKPLFEKNQDEIKRLIYLIGYLYKRLGLFILGAGIILSFFFPIIFGNQSIREVVIYVGFYSYLFAAVFGFFINYAQVVLSADQRGYIITSYYQSFNIARQVVQALIAYYLQSPLLWLSMEAIFSIANSYYINKKVHSSYPYINQGLKTNKNIFKEYPVVIKKIKQVFVHKISSFVTSGTDQLLIYALVSLKSVAFFGNYYMIFHQINVLVSYLFSGMAAGVGNLVAENNIKQIKKIFWEMMGIRVCLAGIIIINLYYLADPFIVLWLGEQYILERMVINLMMFNLVLQIIRLPIDNYITAYGLYQDTWAPIAQMFINLGVSIVFGLKMGIAGIMLGTSISMFTIIFLWKPYFLFKNGFQQKALAHFWPNFAKVIASLVISFVLVRFTIDEFMALTTNSIQGFAIALVKINLIAFLVIPLILYLFNKGFRDFITRLIYMLKKR